MKSVSEKGLSLAAEFPPSPIAAVTQIFFLILFFPEYQPMISGVLGFCS